MRGVLSPRSSGTKRSREGRARRPGGGRHRRREAHAEAAQRAPIAANFRPGRTAMRVAPRPAAHSAAWLTRAAKTFSAPMLGAAFVIVAGLPLAALLNIWVDEAFTLHTTGAGVPFAWQQSIHFELQPPLYFVLVAAWRLLDEGSVFFARLPSIAFAAFAVALIVVLARRVAPRLPSPAVAAVTAFNPIVIWAAVEMRSYALVLCVGAALLLTFADGFLAARPAPRAQVLYVAVGVLGLYTQYYVGFILLAQAIVLLFANRAAFRQFVIAGICITILFVPFAPFVIEHIHASAAGDTRHVSFPSALHAMANASFSYILPHDIGWTGLTKLAGFAVSAVLGGAIFVLGRPKIERQERWLFWLWLTACVTFSAFFAVSGEAVDIRRHAVIVAPITLLGAYCILSSLGRHRSTLTALSLAAYVVFSLVAYDWLYGWPVAKTGDWRHVAHEVGEAAPDAPVAVFPADTVFALGRYMPQTRLIPIPQPMPFSSTYLKAMVVRSEAQVAAAVTAGAGARRDVWLVSDGSCDGGSTAYDFHCSYVEDYFAGHYTLVRHLRFHGADAKLFTRRDGPAGATLPQRYATR